MEAELHIAPLQLERIRFQEYGIGIFSTLTTKSALKKAIKKGAITIDGLPATTAVYIEGGEKIKYRPKTEIENQVDLNLNVVFEDDFLAIIDKPAGVLVSGNKLKTISNALPVALQKSEESDSLLRPQPAHRLDFATSGLLIVGKTKRALVGLNRLFKSKNIFKTYHAVTIGMMERSSGIISQSIDDKKSVTSYLVLRTENSARFTKLNLVRLTPETGRRHQIRKHLQAIGNPILGDALYCSKEMLLKGKGLYLQASGISFEHPITQEKIEVSISLPKKFKRIFK